MELCKRDPDWLAEMEFDMLLLRARSTLQVYVVLAGSVRFLGTANMHHPMAW